MNSQKWTTSSDVADVVRVCLEEGLPVEIDGIGLFRPAKDGGFVFIPETRPRVFLAYAAEDQQAVERLYDDLEALGFDPWMDRRKLLPGQNWPDSIRRTIEVSDYFIACFSESSVRKRGHFQAELRLALETAATMPLDDVYFIPVRLAYCRVPVEIARRYQYVDLFPNWEAGLKRVAGAIRRGRKAA